MAYHSDGGGEKGNGSVGQENDGDLNCINQLKKIIDMQMPMKVRFLDHQQEVVDYDVAKKLLLKYVGLRTSIQKEQMMMFMWRSPEHLHACINRDFSPF